jgi:hypothetical protein
VDRVVPFWLIRLLFCHQKSLERTIVSRGQAQGFLSVHPFIHGHFPSPPASFDRQFLSRNLDGASGSGRHALGRLHEQHKTPLVASGRLMKVNATTPVLFITHDAENAVIGNGHLDAGMSVITESFGMIDLASEILEMSK